MVYAIISIAILGMSVWSHHMYTVGLDSNSKAYFSSATLVIAIPTGIKIFSWLTSLYGSRIKEKNVIFLYLIGFIFLFTLGRNNRCSFS